MIPQSWYYNYGTMYLHVDLLSKRKTILKFLVAFKNTTFSIIWQNMHLHANWFLTLQQNVYNKLVRNKTTHCSCLFTPQPRYQKTHCIYLPNHYAKKLFFPNFWLPNFHLQCLCFITPVISTYCYGENQKLRRRSPMNVSAVTIRRQRCSPTLRCASVLRQIECNGHQKVQRSRITIYVYGRIKAFASHKTLFHTLMDLRY